ncbi:CLUMA_CG020369, isoform A [Clunio marinus]|uniref:CLUMA_CG020369, isoform A n=1 Tax=Clunio marinus TaxID=568069 RepID=A0A1J1J6I9_9DIPT|nr:CLUMA_CG020369, isoform A [Clunio marinus]
MKLLAILLAFICGFVVTIESYNPHDAARAFFTIDANGNPMPIRPIVSETLKRDRRQIQPFGTPNFGFQPLQFPQIQPGQGQGSFVSNSISSRFGEDGVQQETHVVHSSDGQNYQQTNTYVRPDGTVYSNRQSGRLKRQTQTQIQSQDGEGGEQSQTQSQSSPGGTQFQSQSQGQGPDALTAANQPKPPTSQPISSVVPLENKKKPSAVPAQNNQIPAATPAHQGNPDTESRNPQNYPQQGQNYPQQGPNYSQQGPNYPQQGYQPGVGGPFMSPFGPFPQGFQPQGPFGPFGPQAGFGQAGFGQAGFGPQPGFGFGNPFLFQQPGFGGVGPIQPGPGTQTTFTGTTQTLDNRFGEDSPVVTGGTQTITSQNGNFHVTTSVLKPNGQVVTTQQSGNKLDSRFGGDDVGVSGGGTTTFTSGNGVFHSTSTIIGPDGKVRTQENRGNSLDSRFGGDDMMGGPFQSGGGTTSFTSGNGVFHSSSSIQGPDGRVVTRHQSGRTY